MAKKFSTLRNNMTSVAQGKARQRAQELLADLPLQELRQARHHSQVQLAQALNVEQPSFSKVERRTDMYISTLRSYIEAMGGKLEILAHFPDGDVRINQFTGIDDEDETLAKS